MGISLGIQLTFLAAVIQQTALLNSFGVWNVQARSAYFGRIQRCNPAVTFSQT